MKATASIACKNCGNDLWDIIGDKAECSNCGFERPYHSRKPSNEIVPSQQRAIDRIEAFFDDRRYRDVPKELTRFEVKPTDHGQVWVTVETTENVFTMQGGLFLIGPRGKVETKNVYDLCDDKKERARFYDKMLK